MPLHSHHPPPAVELTEALCTSHYPSSDSPPPAAPLRAAPEVPEGTPEAPFWSSPHSSRMCYAQTLSKQCTHIGKYPFTKGILAGQHQYTHRPIYYGPKTRHWMLQMCQMSIHDFDVNCDPQLCDWVRDP